MGKININGVETLGSLKLNGREYAFGLQGNNLDYYERQSNEFGYTYVAPKKDYTLEGNAGTSLTKLNERIFMQHIADELKNDIKIGKLNGKKEIEDSILKMQQVFDEEDPDKLKTLFKGNAKNIDEDLLKVNSKRIINYLETRRKALSKSNDFDFIDGGVDKTFTVNIQPELKKELLGARPEIKKEEVKSEIKRELPILRPEIKREAKDIKVDSTFEELSPTIIVDKLVSVPKKEIVAETKKEEPRTSIMGVKDKDLSDDIIKTILEKKQDKITPEQGAYLEKILDKREEAKEMEVESLLPNINRNIKEEEEEPTKEFTPNKKFSLDDTITSLEEFNRMKEQEPKEEKEESKGKQKTISRKAAYVDTVILCLLVQLGIFALLIFVLLLIK